MQPNRLERHWPYISARLRQHYPRVPESLWNGTEWQPDRIVRLIRDTYAPGRSDITVEAEVKDLLVQWCDEIEDT